MIKPNRRILRVLVALVIAAYALAGLQGLLTRLGAAGRPHPATGTVTELLAGLTIAPETGRGSYQREAFGDGWATRPEGCDTRSRVLTDESLAPTTVDQCHVVTGRWLSIYDGTSTTRPDSLDIDHLVPLAEAWSSGASTWTDHQRQAFANDTDPARPDALIAVTAESNRAKGDSDPAEWLPPDPRVRCRYATAWVTQKAAWNLTVDPAEHQALTQVLATCPPGADHG